MNDEDDTRRRWLISRKALGLSFAIAVLLSFAATHVFRTDVFHLATLVPLFMWVTAGLVLTIAITSGKPRLLLVLTWIVSAWFLGDAPISLFRRPQQPSEKAAVIRVVSLNCLSNPAALHDVAELHPDIVLLQEAPASQYLDWFVETIFDGHGTAFYGSDTSLIVKGTAILRTEPHRSTTRTESNFIGAEVELDCGVKLGVVSLRLLPTPIRLDIYNPDCWRFYSTNHAERRSAIKSLGTYLERNNNLPMVIGGDFNTPANDSVFRFIPPGFVDAWQVFGVGWGKTITNNMPLHRIDQVWITKPLSPISTRAVCSAHSDHRAVVCDLAIEKAK